MAKKKAKAHLIPATQRDTLTRAKKLAFLTAIANLGNIRAASEAVGMNRASHYRWLEADVDGAYRNEFDTATQDFSDRLHSEARRRAVEGVDEPVVYQGKIQKSKGKIVAVRKFSDRLLEIMLKAHRPEFRDKVEHSGSISLEQILSESNKPQ